MVDAYPLQWPHAWPRTADHKKERSNFKQKGSGSFGGLSRTTFQAAGSLLYSELGRLGARSIVLSSNLRLRGDGVPYATQERNVDQGVAVYFVREGKEQCIPCDKWDRAEDNIKAIGKTIEALRGIERWGAKNMVDAAFRGFQALPSPDMVMAMPQQRSWHDVLGVSSEAPEAVRKAAYRALARTAHPDTGGSREEWDQLQKAAKEAGL